VFFPLAFLLTFFFVINLSPSTSFAAFRRSVLLLLIRTPLLPSFDPKYFPPSPLFWIFSDRGANLLLLFGVTSSSSPHKSRFFPLQELLLCGQRVGAVASAPFLGVFPCVRPVHCSLLLCFYDPMVELWARLILFSNELIGVS